MQAPRVFISYSHDSPAHQDRILALSGRLNDDGIDCIIDQYEQSPEEGWPLWCESSSGKFAFNAQRKLELRDDCVTRG